MKLFLKFENTLTYPIEIENENIKISDLISKIKKQIFEGEKINPEIKLFFSEKELEDDKKLSEYDIKPNSEILIKNLEIDFEKKKKIDKIIENLKTEANNFKINEIDTSKINTQQLNYDNFILKKIYQDYKWYTAPLKKITKKNCYTDENKFSFKIINSLNDYIFIGLADSNFNFLQSNHIGQNLFIYGYCCDGNKYHNSVIGGFCSFSSSCTVNDIVGLEYNSKIGSIEIFKNGNSLSK
jgi:hypothetical protein